MSAVENIHTPVGGLVGINDDVITNCYSTGNVSGTGGDELYIGGLVGENDGTINTCYSTGSVSGNELVGGLVGYNFNGPITNCYSTGSVSGYGGVGGLAGLNSSGTIINCCATGTVSGDYSVGGLVGWNYDTIDKCYSTGAVTGSKDFGGLVGYNHSSGTIVTASFWDIETSDCNTSAAGTPKTTAEMKTKSTFTDAGWDFVNIWDICEGTNYPKLIWQIHSGDFACPDGVNMEDLSYFVERWLLSDCASSNNCGGADMDSSGTVDFADFAMFTENWLEGP